MMKIYFLWTGLLLCQLLCPVKTIAQSAAQPRNNNTPRISTCTPEELIGLIKYDHQEAAEKMGISRSSASFDKFDRLLQDHDAKVDGIVKSHQDLFEGLYALKAQYEERATLLQDFQPLVELIHLMYEKLRPIADEVAKESEYLDILVAHVLQDKQFRKWKRYRVKVKKRRGPRYPRPMAGPLVWE
ncbi:hypothetical protein [Algoriphagus aestuariicola]